MEEVTKVTDEGIETNEYLIKKIEELKKTSIPREKYDAMVQERNQAIDALVNGQQIELPQEKSAADIDGLRKELFDRHGQLSNLEYVEKALELRDALIERDGIDPFIPVGKQIAPTPEDVVAANRVADAFKACIEYADGDSEVFTNELMRITNDAFPQYGKRR